MVARNSQHHAYRISGISNDWEETELQAFLREYCRANELRAKGDDPADNKPSTKDILPRIFSLALEPDRQSKTATVTFQDGNAPRSPISGDDFYIEIDDTFEGITPLYSPPKADHKIDIIAISGLGGHAFGSFKQKGGAHMWLRDSLPKDLIDKCDGENPKSMARILLYGYGSDLRDHDNFQSMEDIASTFRTALQDCNLDKPIIFIGHSLGGIIVKEVIISWSRSQNHKKLLHLVYGILFFGVPHQGMAIESLIPLTGSLNRGLLETLNRHNSPTLEKQLEHFLEALRERRITEIVSYRETRKSPTAQKINNDPEKWEMNGPSVVLVDLPSATIQRPKDDGPTHMIAIDRTHSEMVKFGKLDRYYKVVRGELLSLCKRAIENHQKPHGRMSEEPPERQESAHRAKMREKEIWSRIPYATGAAFDEIGVGHELCVKGTRVQLLEEIERWAADGDQKRGFWLQGLAGTGKSTIARTVAVRLKEKGPRIASFFFRRGAGDRSNASVFVSTIVRQLSGYPELRTRLLKAWEESIRFSGMELANQWGNLIKQPLLGCIGNPIILVIDAVDECQRTRWGHEIFDFLSNDTNFEGLSIRLFVTSRPLREEENTDIHHLFLLHKVDSTLVAEDIRTFFKAKLGYRESDNQRRHPRFPDIHQIDALTKRCSPLFIAASTSYMYISTDESGQEERFDALIGASKGLELRGEESLEDMYITILKDDLLDSNDPEAVKRKLEKFQSILGSALLLRDGLHYEDLASLVSESPSSVFGFLGELRAVLEVPEVHDPVRLFHQSFPEFLLDKNRIMQACRRRDEEDISKLLCINITERSTKLFHQCLDVMEGRENAQDDPCFLEKGDICNLQYPAALAATVTKQTLAYSITPLLTYSCRSWVSHLTHSQRLGDDDAKRLKRFLHRHLLHWLEAMSCLSNIDEAVVQLDQARQFLRKAQASSLTQSELHDFVVDASRFVRHSKDGIKEAPLQVYISALIFAPSSSLVKKQFTKAIPTWVVTPPVGAVPHEWSALVLEFTVHAHNIRSIAFSPGGQKAVSVDEGGNLMVWKYETGLVLSRTKLDIGKLAIGHAGALDWGEKMFDISPDGVLAFVDHDGNITLWFSMDQKKSRTLSADTYQRPIHQVKYSPDGNWLASLDDDGNVIMWDMKRYSCGPALETPWPILSRVLATHPMHDYMEFSSEVSWWPNETLFIWAQRRVNGATKIILYLRSRGRIEWKFYRHFYLNRWLYTTPVIADKKLVCFSSSTNHYRAKFFIYDLENDEHSRRLKIGIWHHLYKPIYFQSMRFLVWPSPKGSIILQTLENYGVRDAPFLELEDSSGYVSGSIATSDDGKFFAAGSHNVAIWDTLTGRKIAVLDEDMPPGDSWCEMVFTPGGEFLVTNDSSCARVWDFKRLQRKESRQNSLLEGLPGMQLISTSHDGKLTAMERTGADGTISIDVSILKDYDLHPLMRLQSKFVKSNHSGKYRHAEHLVFSKNNERLARVFGEGEKARIEIWNLKDNTKRLPMETFIPRDFWGTALFSPDGRYMAWGTNENAYISNSIACPDQQRSFGSKVKLEMGRSISVDDSRPSTFFVTSLKKMGNIIVFQVTTSSTAEDLAYEGFYWVSHYGKPISLFGRFLADLGKVAIVYNNELHLVDARTSIVVSTFKLPAALHPAGKICSQGNCVSSSSYGNYTVTTAAKAETCPCGTIPVRRMAYSNWLYWAEKPFLWLPPEYRSLFHSIIEIRGTTVQISNKRGYGGILMEFSRDLDDVLKGQAPMY